jgi:hypothetical protein
MKATPGKSDSRGWFGREMAPNTSLELTMGAGGSRARRSGRWVLRAGGSSHGRYAAARRRRMNQDIGSSAHR